MHEKLLQDHIDPFIRKFKNLNADRHQSTLVVFVILDELQKTIANIPHDKAILRNLNGTKPYFGEICFIPTQVNSKNLLIFLSLNNFLYNLESFSLNEQNAPTQSLLKLLKSYRTKSLLAGLNNYKESCLFIPKPSDVKLEIENILAEVKATLQSDINQYRKTVLQRAINQKDEQYNITKLIGKSFADKTKATLLEHSTWLVSDAFVFIDELENLLKKTQLSYRDLYALKNSSFAFQKLALSLPSVQEVTHFHWLINFLINLVNKFIVLVESEKSIKIKQICTSWHARWIDTAEKEVIRLDRQIYLH